MAAILFADVVGYSSRMGADEMSTLRAIKTLQAGILEPKATEFGGRIVKTMGDGALIEFSSAVDAVECAIEVMRMLDRNNVNVPDEQRTRLRIGVNLGDVIVDGDDLYGDGVNVAARVQEAAQPDEILISGMVYGGVRNKLDLPFEDLGDRTLKNIAEPVRLYRVDRGPAALLDAEPATILRRPAVAVLPFQNISGDPEQEYFADGLTEDIITLLSLWKSFPVIARNSTFSYKGASPDIRAVGKGLGARYVLEGSVRRAGQRVRITAQLIDAENGHHVWAERYDRQLDDIFELQDEVTHRIVATLAPELERVERRNSAQKAPATLDAWDCYLHGVAHMNELGPDAAMQARAMLERAIEMDPSYARAHAKLALSRHRELWLGQAESRAATAAAMLKCAEDAVRLDSGDAFAHCMLALALVWDGRIDLALEELQHALALNPIDVDSNFTMGVALSWNGEPEAGVPHIENALKISPNDPRSPMFFSQLAAAHFDAGQDEMAAQWSQKAIESARGSGRNGNASFAHLVRIAALLRLGRAQDAQAALAAAGPLEPHFEAADGLFSLRLRAPTRSAIQAEFDRADIA